MDETDNGDPDENGDCTVTTTVTVNAGEPSESSSVDDVDTDGGATVTFENGLTCVAGDTTFSVDKEIADGSDPFPGDTEFVIEVTCVPPEGANITGTFTFDENGDLIDAESDTLPLQVPTGSDCTATETDNGGSDDPDCSVSTSIDGTPWEDQSDPSKTVEDVDGQTTVFENGLTCVGGIQVLPLTGSGLDMALRTAAWLLGLGVLSLLVSRRRRDRPSLVG